MTSKFALIIANTEYRDLSFAKLTAPGKDAEEFAHILRDPDLAAFNDVQILLNKGEGEIRRSVARFFANRNRDDLLLLYFSGHGVRNDLGQLFLAATDTEKVILDATGIPAEFITHIMNSSPSKKQVLILDCCNSGAFAYGAKADSAIGKSMGMEMAFNGDGRWVLTATNETQYAWEGDKILGDAENSVYTHFLIEGLKGDADKDGDGNITVDELHEYAHSQVKLHTDKQTPTKWSYKVTDPIILRDNLRPADVPPVVLQSDILEFISNPNTIVRNGAIQALIKLLDGNHPGKARAAEEKLLEIVSNDDSVSLRNLARDALNSRGINADIRKMEKQAKHHEQMGDIVNLWRSRQMLREIKKQAPLFPKIDESIINLKKKLIPKIALYLLLSLLVILTSVTSINFLSSPNARPPLISSPVLTHTPTNVQSSAIFYTSTLILTPALSQTPTSTPSLTPSPTPLPIVTTVSKCRSGPTVLDVESPVIVQIPQDGVIEIVGRNGQGDWLWISWIDKKTEKKYTCWISAILVDFTVDPTVVPTVLTPIPPTRVIVGPVGSDGQPVEIIQVIAPGQASCSTGQDCGVSVNITWENRVGSRICVYVQPKEVPNQPYYFQFEGTSGTAWLGPAPDNTPFEIIAVSTTSTCGGSLPGGKSKSATVIRINN